MNKFAIAGLVALSTAQEIGIPELDLQFLLSEANEANDES